MRNKVGLVLEGGGLRGMYTAGVLDVFLEQGIDADLIVGVSAGALFGVNYVSKQKGRALRYNKRFNSDRNYMGIKPLLKEGNIISTEYAYERVPYHLDPFDNETFKASTKEFYAVATNVETGKPEYMRVKDVFEQMDVLRASGALPFVSKPVRINGNDYLDGALGDNIPYAWAKNQGIDKMIVILTRDPGYRKKAMSPLLCSLYSHKSPKIAEALRRRHLYYNQQIDELKKLKEDGEAFLIQPTKQVEISRLERDPEKMQAGYELGQQDAERILSSLQKYLNS